MPSVGGAEGGEQGNSGMPAFQLQEGRRLAREVLYRIKRRFCLGLFRVAGTYFRQRENSGGGGKKLKIPEKR